MATACIAHSAFRVHGISKSIIARFDQPQASSDGGAILLKALDDRLGLTWQFDLLFCMVRIARLMHSSTWSQDAGRARDSTPPDSMESRAIGEASEGGA